MTDLLRKMSTRLSFKQARLAVLVAVILGSAGVAVQVWFDLDHERARIENFGAQILAPMAGSFSRAAFRLDEVVAAELARGVAEEPSVLKVRVVDDFGDVLTSVDTAPSTQATPFFSFLVSGTPVVSRVPLVVRPENLAVGFVEVTVDPNVAAAAFSQRTWLAILSGVAKSTGLALILTLLFHLTVTRRVEAIAARYSSDQAGVPTHPRSDELDELDHALQGWERERARLSASGIKQEKALRQALELLTLAQASGDIGTWDYDLVADKVRWDDINLRLHGLPEGGYVGDFAKWAAVIHPDDMPRMSREYKAALDGQAAYDTEYRVVWGNGEIKHLKGNATIIRDAEGVAVRIVGVNYDLTRLRRSEAELTRTQLIAAQAQKMEGIGHLTGGVAHDFNNLLAIILGNLELLQEAENDAVLWEDRHDIIDNAIMAAKRGGDLTTKMLAYARKSTLDPKPLDLNAAVQETERWLSRTIPANIEIETQLSKDAWQANLDPASLQSAIVNTVLNARDAMPEGGLLRIEISNHHVDQQYLDQIGETMAPGRYVRLSIRDTGSGIVSSNLNKVFDPFFTTKELGFGTGLGLSMVQGFVKQSDGFVCVRSIQGQGTTIEMYFPAVAQSAGPGTGTDAPHTPEVHRTGQRILLVDDQVEILDVLERSLTLRGYAVDVALDGDAALGMFRAADGYDLVITDVMMPGRMQGPQLAAELRRIAPDLPVVFMSGYAPDAISKGHAIRPDDTMLMKPVSARHLQKAIEHALARRSVPV